MMRRHAVIHASQPALAGLLAVLALLAALCLAAPLRAAPVALADEELGAVSGRDGIGLAVHLELNSALSGGRTSDGRLSAGFQVDGKTTYLVLHQIGGVVDLVALTLNVRQRADGSGDYLDLALPGFVGVRQFGVRAITAQTDAQAPAAAGAGYGQLLLNGTATLSGRLYLWAP